MHTLGCRGRLRRPGWACSSSSPSGTTGTTAASSAATAATAPAVVNLVVTVNPDAAAPDTWGRPFYYTFGNNNGPLNFLLGSVPSADALMDQGLAATDPQVVQQDYGKAGGLYAASGDFITIADVKEVIVAQAGYINFVHQPPVIFTVGFGDLKFVGHSLSGMRRPAGRRTTQAGA